MVFLHVLYSIILRMHHKYTSQAREPNPSLSLSFASALVYSTSDR